MESVEERFWSKVEIGNPFECWEWKASIRKHSDGYGAFHFNGRHHQSQRIAWMLIFGEIPIGMSVCHRCDNPKCCNPEHLFIGTHKDNNDDKVLKKRHAYGSSNGNSKLNDEIVKSIICEYKSMKPWTSKKDLAAKHGITVDTIYDIITCRSWKHIPR